MEHSKENQNLSRREVLKALAATGGALGAAAFLPGKWVKPVIEAGVLPAHAQGTEDTLMISQQVAVWYTSNGIDAAPNPSGYSFQAMFYYYDTGGEVGDSAKLWATGSPCGETYASGQTLTTLGADRYGNGYNGSIYFDFDSIGCVNGGTLTVQLGVNDRKSNFGTGNIPAPV